MNKEIFERFSENFPDIMFGKKEAMTFEAGEGWDTFSVEMHDDIFSIAHTYEQNGDLMYDPLIYFKVDYDKEKVIPISYENSEWVFTKPMTQNQSLLQIPFRK